MNNKLSLNHVITRAAQHLINKGFKNAKNEIIWYLESLRICTREQIYLDEIIVNDNLQKNIQIFCNQRILGVPFQYILQKSNFYGRDFYINQHTLIPRPETELFIDILKHCFFKDALEIGTGSGVLAITLSLEKIIHKIIATDISTSALSVAKKNLDSFNLSNILLEQHDFLNQSFNKKFDLIISNPPYVSSLEYQQLSKEIIDYEPEIALTDKQDGLSFYLRFANILRDILKSDGTFLCEMGSTQSVRLIKKIFLDRGYTIKIHKDLNLDERILQINLS